MEGKIMPLTTLDTNAALIVIDLQKGLVATPVVHPIDGIIGRSAQLARAFRERGLPVVLISVAGGAPGRTDVARHRMSLPPDFTELVPELGQHVDDILITKQRVGAFLGTSLDEILRQRGVTQIFLTGIATSNGVEATARSAYDLGYNLVLVTDAMTDRDADMHRHSVEKIFPRLGETDTTDNVLKLLHIEVVA
jgi:nicotinamidase-related amidase